MQELAKWVLNNIWLVLFLIWSFPAMGFRSKFRKIVYQTEDWKINLKPVFVKELKGLFGNLFPNDEHYIQTRNLYRIYLLVYVILLILWQWKG